MRPQLLKSFEREVKRSLESFLMLMLLSSFENKSSIITGSNLGLFFFPKKSLIYFVLALTLRGTNFSKFIGLTWGS